MTVRRRMQTVTGEQPYGAEVLGRNTDASLTTRPFERAHSKALDLT